MAYLMPITLLTHWMANCRLFYEHETWNRKWSFSVAFTADFWPELSTLANSLRLLKNNGFYNGFSALGNSIQPLTLLINSLLDNTDEREGAIIPEIANSFGVSSVFNAFPKRFLVENEKTKAMNVS